jgi:hypothetical protein
MLRFAAAFKDPAPQDRFRKFVISFYLSDDTLAVFELPMRNSGFREGKFIQRAKLKNPKAGNRDFVASDFRVGDEVTINGYVFHITDADEYAKSLMEAEATDYPQSDLAEIFAGLKRDKAAIATLRTALEPYDRIGNGYADPAAAEQIIVRAFGIPTHEAMTVVRRWTNDWGFDYFGFISQLTA